jgi:hypothetical protein
VNKKRVLLAALLAAAIAVAAGVTSSTEAGAALVEGDTVVYRGGIVKVDAAGVWSVAEGPARAAVGLTGVTCDPASGALTVAYDPFDKLVEGSVQVDLKYFGVYDVAQSAGLDSTKIKFRDAGSRALVGCDDVALRISGSNLYVRAVGVDSPAPTTEPTTDPTSPAATTPPTTQPPVTTAPTSPTPPPTSQTSPPPPIG